MGRSECSRMRCLTRLQMFRVERHQGKYCSKFEEDHMVVIYTQGVRRWCSCNVISMQSRGVRRCSHGEFVMLTYAWYTVGSFITILGHGLYVHMLHPWSVHCCFSISHTRLHSLRHWQLLHQTSAFLASLLFPLVLRRFCRQSQYSFT